MKITPLSLKKVTIVKDISETMGSEPQSLL